jgi:radial spoke head protein 9
MMGAHAALQAAMDHSIPIKRSEAGLKSMVLWGRLLARNGKVR